MRRLPKAVRRYLAQIGAKGGSASTPEKAAAVRENGKLGGRPPKHRKKKKAAALPTPTETVTQ